MEHVLLSCEQYRNIMQQLATCENLHKEIKNHKILKENLDPKEDKLSEDASNIKNKIKNDRNNNIAKDNNINDDKMTKDVDKTAGNTVHVNDVSDETNKVETLQTGHKSSAKHAYSKPVTSKRAAKHDIDVHSSIKTSKLQDLKSIPDVSDVNNTTRQDLTNMFFPPGNLSDKLSAGRRQNARRPKQKKPWLKL